VTTHSGFDFLRVGEEVASIPARPIAALWPPDIYDRPYTAIYGDGNGREQRVQLLDLNIDIDTVEQNSVRLMINGGDVAWTFLFSLSGPRAFMPLPGEHRSLSMCRGDSGRVTSLIDYLNEHHAILFLADGSIIDGNEWFRHDPDRNALFDGNRIEDLAWTGGNVNIENEFDERDDGTISIHAYLGAQLNVDENEVVVYDHRPGEVADYVVVTELDGQIRITLYHCKGSSDPRPGHRVEDLYEVCGQVIKSTKWVHDTDALGRQLADRTRPGGSRFIRGDMARLRDLIGRGRRMGAIYEMVIVQPGVLRGRLGTEPFRRVAHLLASVEDYTTGASCAPLRIIGSAR